ncbi:hypothetical protein [Streptomyces sp. enrichment culture]|uniref:hypothetical protein n=1 Tax=Streptomyces sp. enrichment culture TaxID=1795815 RepID=UPI003F5582EC
MNQSVLTDRQIDPALATPDDRLKFAELMTRAFLDPATARRYAAAPSAVLAEFGVAVGAGGGTPALPRPAGQGVVREDFSGLGDAGVCLLTLCIADTEYGTGAQPATTNR